MVTSTSKTLMKAVLAAAHELKSYFFFLRITFSSFSMSSIGKNPYYQTVLFLTTLKEQNNETWSKQQKNILISFRDIYKF